MSHFNLRNLSYLIPQMEAYSRSREKEKKEKRNRFVKSSWSGKSEIQKETLSFVYFRNKDGRYNKIKRA
jgi:hypothetical protein